MIWHELQNHFVSVGVDIDFGRIGLAQYILQVKKNKQTSQNIMGFLNHGIGLTYLPSTMVSDSIIAFVAIPENQSYKLEALLEYLASIKVIQDYSMEKIIFARHVSFDHSLYNFRKGRWQFDWRDIESIRVNKTVRPPSCPKNYDNQVIDYKDLLRFDQTARKVLCVLDHSLN